MKTNSIISIIEVPIIIFGYSNPFLFEHSTPRLARGVAYVSSKGAFVRKKLMDFQGKALSIFKLGFIEMFMV